MAYIKYKPESVEFYAPDTFERLGEMSYCTVDNAVAAKNYVLANNCDSCDSCFTVADYADTASVGYTSRLVNVKTTTDDLQEQIDNLRSAIEELKESAGKGLFKKYHLREGLKTLHREYEVLV